MGTIRTRSGIASYFARIDLPMVFRQPRSLLTLIKNDHGLVCAKTATAAFAHTNPLNCGSSLVGWLKIKITISQ